MQPHERFRVVSAEPTASERASEVAAEEIDLASLLAAWQTATDRLQLTHQTLREEVKRLTDELEIKNRELARKNRLADLGQMAAHVAHEVRNSLVPMTLYLSLLRRRLSDDRGSLDVVDKISTGFTGLEATVTDLLGFTSDREPQWGDFAVRPLIDAILESLAPQLEAQGISWSREIPASTTLCADRDQVRRAVLNLVLNAIDAMPDGGELVITSWLSSHGLELEVADSGAGIAAEKLDRIFEPFFTTKREGTGLGLAIVQRIVESHAGQVSVANCPEGGAAFTLRFPRRAWE
ncbi:MAG TPA: ATP-binding protein, partial [Pirellulaceae bacterium]|nr:ATP-binding protein [Pirellulaceae bacterium]